MLQTVNESKVKAALKSLGNVTTEEQLNTLVCMELDAEKLILQEEFNKKVRELTSFYQFRITRNIVV